MLFPAVSDEINKRSLSDCSQNLYFKKTFAQKTERDYLRSGNKLYNDSLFIKAEIDYRKALEINPKSTDAMFNLGNSLLMQQKAKEAMEQFESASKVEKDKDKLAQIYHNMGVILQYGFFVTFQPSGNAWPAFSYDLLRISTCSSALSGSIKLVA